MEEGRQYGMNPEVFRYASSDSNFFEALTDPSSSTLLEVTVGKNTVLHVALQFKKIDAAKNIVNLSPRLVYETNSKGNTPLHVAASVGDSSMVKLLIDQAKKLDVETGGRQQLLSMVNQDGDTALHVAVRYGNFDVVKELINEKDPAELLKQVNKVGESALFLAVDKQHYEMASHILSNDGDCSYAGRDGMNVLHALVIHTSTYSEKDDLLLQSNMKKYGRAGPAGQSRTHLMRVVSWGLGFPCFLLILVVFIMVPTPMTLLVLLLVLVLFGVLSLVMLFWEYYEKLMRLWKYFVKDDERGTIQEGHSRVCLMRVFRLGLGFPCFLVIFIVFFMAPSSIPLWVFILALMLSVVLLLVMLFWEHYEKLMRLWKYFVKDDERGTIQEDLVKQVMRKWPSTIEQGDDSGWTPLHIAVHLGNWRLVRLLLKNDNSGRAYARNKEGLSALHIAAKENNYPVVSELMEACPDISELLDNRGRNALHAAAESGGWKVVVYFRWSPQFEGLINEKDEEGNTPLHLAVINGHDWIASFLLKDGLGVDTNGTNEEGITPLDYLLLRKQLRSRPTMPLSSKGARPISLMKAFIRNLFPKRIKKQLADNGYDYDNADGTSISDLMKQIKNGKSSIGARLSLKGALLKVGIRNLQGNDDGNGNGKGTSVSDFGREVSETNLLVATLITTVTFTAAFTVPGGYNQGGDKSKSSDDAGLAVLRETAAFGVFLIANTLAFGFSTTSVLIHFLLASDTSTEDVYHSEVIQRAPFFTNWSIGALLVAFISGTYTVVQHSFGISVAIILFCCFLGSMLFPSLNKEV